MKKQDKDAESAAVEAMLDAARKTPPPVPERLMTRVLADAEALQPAAVTAPAGNRPGFFARMGEFIGGWQGMGGLVAATCAGIWIGWNPPAALPDAGALILGYDTAEVMSTTAELTSFGWDVDGG